MKLVVVGGVAGGLSFAARMRRLDESAEIVVFEKGPYPSFSNCGLPFYVGQEIPARESLLLNTDKTILEISEECGFSDVKYYYSAFKRWYNCTPKQFRDQYGRASEEKLRYFELDDISDLIDDLMKQHYMQMYLG